MKVCPKCNQTYSDASLNFCLNDGAQLRPADGSQPTILVNQPNFPSSGQQFGAMPGQVPPAAAQMPAARPKSRAWIWVLGILGGVILLCGGGFAALVALIPDADKTARNVSGNQSAPVNVSYPSNAPKTNATVIRDDFAGWKPANETVGTTEYADGKLTMSSNTVGYYYVLMTPKIDHKSDGATVKVTVKNDTADTTTYGFGVIVQGERKEPLKKDYAFLIDSESKRFRVARHRDKNEETVVQWERSAVINGGSAENVLEVRDEQGKLSFFINGQLVREFTDTVGIKNGHVGLYVSDAVPITFSNLEIRK